MYLIVDFVSIQILVGVRGDGDTEGSKAPPSPMEMVMNIIKFGNSKRYGCKGIGRNDKSKSSCKCTD